MKKALKFLALAFFTAFVTFTGCKKDAEMPTIKFPTLTTTVVSLITPTSVSTGGNVADNGGTDITDMGVCWSTSPNPTISSNKASNGKGTGSFTTSITGLIANTKYYVRAYASNSAGTSYGNEITFTTNDIVKATTVPTLTTTMVISVTSTTAVSGGNITDDGGDFITQRGICWSTDQLPSIEGTKTIVGTGSGSFISFLTGLNPGTSTKYYVRAYATNGVGTAYGNEVSFSTNPNIPTPTLPTLTTDVVTLITLSTAVSGGEITSDGGEEISYKGICLDTHPMPTIENRTTANGAGSNSFTSYLGGLGNHTTYFIRAYAANSAGIAYGNERIFTTKGRTFPF